VEFAIKHDRDARAWIKELVGLDILRGNPS
jgi:hypothetical protein